MGAAGETEDGEKWQSRPDAAPNPRNGWRRSPTVWPTAERHGRRDLVCPTGAGCDTMASVKSVQTQLCRELGIEYPIFSVGFGISAGPELVSAVSGAGGCGVLGGSSVPAEEIRRRMARVRELTDRPFGVNFIIAELENPDGTEEDPAFVREQIAATIEARAPLLVLFWGDPAPFVEDAHRNGAKIFVQVGSMDEAEAAAPPASMRSSLKASKPAATSGAPPRSGSSCRRR
jgi:nitronate monooxygenase